VYQQHLAFALPAAFRMHNTTYRKTVSQRHFTGCKSEPEIQTVDGEFSPSCTELETEVPSPARMALAGAVAAPWVWGWTPTPAKLRFFL